VLRQSEAATPLWIDRLMDWVDKMDRMDSPFSQ
jgi:hypothetical protein